MKTLRARINLSVQRLGCGIENRGIWVRILSVLEVSLERKSLSVGKGLKHCHLNRFCPPYPGGNTSTC